MKINLNFKIITILKKYTNYVFLFSFLIISLQYFPILYANATTDIIKTYNEEISNITSNTKSYNKLGSVTKLKIPRFAILKTSPVNTRTAPGAEHPINIKYTCPLLPVKIIDEFKQWRRIEDYCGNNGWVHESLLSGKRTAVILEKAFLYSLPIYSVKKKAILNRGVIVMIEFCKNNWCKVRIRKYSGWIEKKYLWGSTND